MFGMVLRLVHPFLLAPENLIVSEDSAKCSEENGMNGGFFHRCEDADGMGTCGRAAVIEIYLNISDEKCGGEI